MIAFENDAVKVIPLYFNYFSKQVKPTFEHLLLRKMDKDLIISAIKETRGLRKIIAVDMQFVSLMGSGDKGKEALADFCELLNDFYFVFFNIQESTHALNFFESDFDEYSVQYCFYHMENGIIGDKGTIKNWGCCVASNDEAMKHFKEIGAINSINNIYRLPLVEMLKLKCTIRTGEKQYLPSSDVYTDTYIFIKNLYLYPEHLLLCVYLLCKEVIDKFYRHDFDGIVGMSNNSAVLANLIGNVLRTKVLYLTNIGPKFALETLNLESKIIKNGKYLYVFDFICLGTEIKNLRSIFVSFKADVIGGVGVCSLIDCEHLRSSSANFEERNSLLVKAHPLFTLSDYNISYNVFISKKDKLEDKADESLT